MKFLCLIYNQPSALETLPPGTFDELMTECLDYDEQLRARGALLDAKILKPAQTAVTLRSRGGKLTVSDGPFAETKEVLGGFQLIEARDLAEALEIAGRIPWTRTGAVEVRAVLE